MLISLSRTMSPEESAFGAFNAALCFAYLEEALPSAVQTHLVKHSKAITAFSKRHKLASIPALTNLIKGGDFHENPKVANTATAYAASLAKMMPTLQQDMNISASLVKILNDVRISIEKESGSAYNRVINKSLLLGDAVINHLFTADDFVSNEAETIKKLSALIKAKTGKAGLGITADKLSKLREKDPEFIKKYNKLRRDMNQVHKDFIRFHVGQSGKSKLSASTLVRELKKAGIEQHGIPAGFVGLIDGDLNFYTTAGLALNARPSGTIIMNSKYDAKTDNMYYCLYTPEYGKGTPIQLYTISRTGRNSIGKFESARAFSRDFQKYRKKWLGVYKTDRIGTLNSICAMMLEITYLTSIRIGTPGNSTGGKETHGLSTLQGKHIITKASNSFKISYEGKAGQSHKHLVDSSKQPAKMIHKDLIELKVEAGPNGNIFVWQGKRINANQVNAYLRSLGVPKKVTIKYFRTVRGTELAAIEFAKCPLYKKKGKLSQKVVMQWLKGSLAIVGQALGHYSKGETTITTALGNYIDPKLIEDFFDQCGVRPPAVIQKTIDKSKY